jgi:hypothetical protein
MEQNLAARPNAGQALKLREVSMDSDANEMIYMMSDCQQRKFTVACSGNLRVKM